MKKQKSTQRTQLLNGCSISQLSVYPKNWKDAGASIKKDWYISYRFYDPLFRDNPRYKYGKLVQVKGMNEYKTLMARRQMTEQLIRDEQSRIVDRGYNPITGKYMVRHIIPDISYEIPPDTPFIKALTLALEKKTCLTATRIDLKSVLKYTGEAARQLRYDGIPIRDIRRPHLLSIFAQLKQNKGNKWTANNHNYYRSHLMMLFEVLILWCTIDINPVEKIPKEKSVKKKRKILTLEQRQKIDEDLRRDNFPFWLHIQIFFLAGCRRVELLRVKGKDVDLAGQRFRAERRKGRSYEEVYYTIPDNAVHLWQMAMVNCGPEDYVFSRGLKPGNSMIRPEQVTRRWRLWVKERIGIEADYYSLKHLQTTEIAAKYGTKIAASFNNESEKMIRDHYDVGYDARVHEEGKKKIRSFTE